MIDLGEQREIRAAPCPKCVLCGGDGEVIYTGLQDRLFEASGSWNFKRCSNRKCRLIWLDPMPLKEDLVKAYTKYYTHTFGSPSNELTSIKRIYKLAQRGYWANRYGYKNGVPALARMLGKLVYLLPVRRMGLDADVKFLRARPCGRLLDVGCGSGEWLIFMQELGWQAEGVDFDECALEAATKKGLQVRCGALEQQDFAIGSFDAVILNHVIEHVPDPEGTLSECWRILKPGGILVVCTPNGASLGHKLFGKGWRGLEPPRHLHVLSGESMQRLAQKAGFHSVSIRPVIAKSIIYESILLSRGHRVSDAAIQRRWLIEGFARLFNCIELCLLWWKPSVSDCLAAIAVK
jgi:2-polyprenyl-3-methyl-5-hydroxy-6-metoxy-1,4-benzoquinol methylase